MHINYTRVPLKGKDVTPFQKDMSATFNGTPLLTERMTGFSICANITYGSGTLAGTLKLQASNNAFADNTSMELNPAAVWVDIPSSSITVSVTADTTAFWNVTDVFYEAVRVVWTRTSGTGTFSPYYLAKG